ncbi:MAG: hypothetical protein V1742_08935, partial [Pseudomonadota bacterium]
MKTIPIKHWPYGSRTSPSQVLTRLGIDHTSPERLTASLPFAGEDVTSGCENEFQAVVNGPRQAVDLPLVIQQSNYLKNIIKRHRRGELPRRVIADLEHWLTDNPDGVWENSWVRFPARRLSPLAIKVLERDLLADKSDPAKGRRGDADRFMFHQGGDPYLCVPVSYLLKLALVEAVGAQDQVPELIRSEGLKYSEHFSCDNTSPETNSFHL